MRKQGKKYRAAAEKLEPGRKYTLDEGVAKVKEISFAKFDETVELTMWLGVDPRKADQLVRGTVVLPHGLGKSKRVLVIASGDKIREAQEAGADFVGGELGKILGPRGLMPNPKTGTVTPDVTTAVRETKAGKVEYRVDKTGVIHVPVGKVSFDSQRIRENAQVLIDAVVRAKPATAKGKYVKKVNLASTMSPGVLLDETLYGR